MNSLLICLSITLVLSVLLYRKVGLINILSLTALYGFVSWVAFLLVNTQIEYSYFINEVTISIVYYLVMYRSDFTENIILGNSPEK